MHQHTNTKDLTPFLLKRHSLQYLDKPIPT